MRDDDTGEPVHGHLWVVRGMLLPGYRHLIATLEGGGKTFVLAWTAVCVATGTPLLGRETEQGSVLIIDEDSPTPSITKRLNRFAQGVGRASRHDIPNLHLKSKSGFRFGRKNSEMMDFIGDLQPNLVVVDSVLTCLPGGRQGLGENNAETGIAIGDTLNEMLRISPGSAIVITAHSSKIRVQDFDVDDYREAEMTDLVRGHGSIVGVACDVGFGLKKFSQQPLPTRFALVPKIRREAIDSDPIYIEVEEEKWGEGWARLKQIDPLPPAPSEAAIKAFSLFQTGDLVSGQKLQRSMSVLYTAPERRLGIEQLLRNRVVVTTVDSFNFKANPRMADEANPDYVRQLREGVVSQQETREDRKTQT